MNIAGFAPTTKKNVMGVAFIEVTLHGANANSTLVLPSTVLSIVGSVQIFHVTFRSDISTLAILKARETQLYGLDS